MEYVHFDRSFEPQEKVKELLFNLDEADEDPITLTKKEYLNLIIENTNTSAGGMFNTNNYVNLSNFEFPYGVCSKTVRDQLPPPFQVKELLLSTSILPFSVIKDEISPCPEDLQLLSYLDPICVNIRGTFILKSFLLLLSLHFSLSLSSTLFLLPFRFLFSAPLSFFSLFALSSLLHSISSSLYSPFSLSLLSSTLFLTKSLLPSLLCICGFSV